MTDTAAATDEQPTGHVLDLGAHEEGRELRRRLIALTRCASTDEARPVLAAVMLDYAGAWACDSYRLAFVPFDTGLPAPSADERGALDEIAAKGAACPALTRELAGRLRADRERLVPAARFAKALREATRKSDAVDVELTDDAARVTVRRPRPGWLGRPREDARPERLVTVELPYVEGTYPNARGLLPDGFDPTLDDDAAIERLAALRQHGEAPPALALPLLDGVAAVARTGWGALQPVVVQHQVEPTRPVHVFDTGGRWCGMVISQRLSTDPVTV